MHLPRADFEELVADAIESLPEEFLGRLDNVEILVEDQPTRAHLRKAGTLRGGLLLGLYEGVPLTGRTAGYNLALPDKITLFQRSIEAVCSTAKQVRDEIRRTVIHEIAHHFGISDARLEELAP